jgi:hypothetical protein
MHSSRFLTFHHESDGRVQRLTLDQGGRHEAVRVEPFTVSSEELLSYVGRYTSAEVGTTYRLVVENGLLVAKHDRVRTQPLQPKARDRFAGSRGTVEFLRDEKGEITALTFSMGRAENIRFDREKPEN